MGLHHVGIISNCSNKTGTFVVVVVVVVVVYDIWAWRLSWSCDLDYL